MGQKMQHYYSQQQELKFCQRQERLLGKWLELRGGVGESTDAQEIREKLGQDSLEPQTDDHSAFSRLAARGDQACFIWLLVSTYNPELKVQIGSLISTLEGERQLMQKYVNRVQDIQAALKT